jgi:undecaprenyl-diphosphatase
MIETLEQIDRSIFLAVNGTHSNLFDSLMYYVSQIWIFIPLFIYWIYLAFKRFGTKKFLILLVFLALLVTLTDQSANQVKHAVKRYRPSHNIEIQAQVHIVNGYEGGQYGFFSGHAANTFGIATLLFFLLSDKAMWFRSLFFLWAGLTAYSRIYLGVHYPSDILVGMLVGITWGLIVYELIQFTFKKYLNEEVIV